MTATKHLLRQLIALAVLLIPMTVSAQASTGTGGATISSFFINLVSSFTGIWAMIAVLVLVSAGFTLMISEDEGAIDKAKKTIIAVLIGGIITTILVTLASSGININAVTMIYNGIPGYTLNTTGATVGLQAMGVSDWLASMAAMLGIVIVIVATVRAVTTFGGDEAAYDNVRNALLQVVVGLIVIAAAYVFRNVFFVPLGQTHTPDPLLAIVTVKVIIVLSIITLIAVAILVYAGFRMVISFGAEDQYTAAKSLAIRVVVGLFIILLSYSLVLIVATIF